MIDEFNDDRTGWARFSDDMTMRLHLARSVSDGAKADINLMYGLATMADRANIVAAMPYDVTVFLMCNPSDADAFKNDPTVGECVKFTGRWRSDILWVVNLWALRSPYPADLRKRAVGFRGDDEVNDRAIVLACGIASRVVAAWGRNGQLDYRAAAVSRMLDICGVKLHHLGTTQDGYPKHPLARGKHRIPADQELQPWSC